MQKEEYLIKNACYSVTKYYLCKRNNKRSLLGRKQRSQVARSFLNRYQFSLINKVTYLFSISCSLRIILLRLYIVIAAALRANRKAFTQAASYCIAISYNTTRCFYAVKALSLRRKDKNLFISATCFVPRKLPVSESSNRVIAAVGARIYM